MLPFLLLLTLVITITTIIIAVVATLPILGKLRLLPATITGDRSRTTGRQGTRREPSPAGGR